ncbi:MAG: SH3 domain-containing protein [Aeromicrobium sp.]
MAVSRHRHALKPKLGRRVISHIIPTIGMMAVVTAGTAAVFSDDLPAITSAPESEPDLIAASINDGPADVSRSADRAPLVSEAAADELVKGQRYAQAALEVHAAASDASPVLATLSVGDKVDVTGVTSGAWAQVMHKDLPRWVVAKSIAKEMPVGTAPCASGSDSERGLRPDTIKVHRAVCLLFPSVTRYGGTSGRGEHATGQAIDIMVGNGNPIGYDIAKYLQEHRAELGIEYIIWHQQIWRPSTSGAWRGMSDRGGATANHMDHVHVTTFGNAATK